MTENNSDAQPALQRQQSPDEIDLIELFDTYVRPYWRRYCIAGLIGGFLFAVVSFFVTPQYEATTTAQVYTGDSTNMNSGLSAQASLAGISMNSGDTDVLFNTNYIRSRELADAFIAQYDLRKELFYKELNDQGEFESSFNLRQALTGWMSSNPVEGVEDEDIFATARLDMSAQLFVLGVDFIDINTALAHGEKAQAGLQILTQTGFVERGLHLL